MVRLLVLSLVLIVAGWGLITPARHFVLKTTAAQEDAPDYGGLPAGPGRDAVYFTCRACHSEKQFTQQRMSREEWDGLLTTMVEENGMEPLEPWGRTLVLAYLSTHYGVDEEDWQGLPPGPGREDVFYLCQTCHSLRTVLQQRLPRWEWDHTLDWMIEEQGMAELEPEERVRILDYLGTRLSATSPR